MRKWCVVSALCEGLQPPAHLAVHRYFFAPIWLFIMWLMGMGVYLTTVFEKLSGENSPGRLLTQKVSTLIQLLSPTQQLNIPSVSPR